MQTIVITGATGGLGSALVRETVRTGCGSTICVCRSSEKFHHLFSDIQDRLHPYISRPDDDYAALAALVGGMHGDEVALVLNAFSIAPIKRIGDYTDDDIADMLQANIRQNVALINVFTRLCRKRPLPLRVINLDSGAADHPLGGWGNYCAAKAYINSFLSVLALENPQFRVVSYDPGVMDTDMQRQIRDTDEQIFDRVGQFISYKNENRLTPPGVIAQDLVRRYLSDWTATAMRERHRP